MAQALEREKSVEDCAGEVVSVSGTVLVRQDAAATGRSPASIQLKPGNNVFQGDVINTSSDGAVKILLKDKTIVDLGASAVFKVALFKKNEGSNRQVNLDMMFGKMRVAVPQKINGKGEFKIKTRAATMGVRGTEFVVNSPMELTNHVDSKVDKGLSAPKTEVTVLQGKVDVASAGPAAAAAPAHLTAGSQMSTQVGAPSAVVKLNDAQMASVSTGSKVQDNTFTKAVTIESSPERSSNSSSSSSTASNSNSNSGSKNRSPAEASSSDKNSNDKSSGDKSSVASSGNSSGSVSTASASAPPPPPPPLPGSLQSTLASITANIPTVPVTVSDMRDIPGSQSVQNAVAPPVQQKQSSYHVVVVVGN